jgi:anti-sigma regulatory factor (Ser/Thr protein kinase)
MGSNHAKLQPRKSVPVGAPESVYAARRALRKLAVDLELGERVTEELTLVVSELATNILKYGAKGRIEVSLTGDLARGPGIQIVAEDTGPMFDLSRAVVDGCDANGAIDPAALFGRKGIGAGLGTVSRFTDSLRIEPLPTGKRIVAVRWARRP